MAIKMEPGTEVFIHIGPHKCATTYLQRSVFPNIENINFIHNYEKFDIKNIEFDYYEERIIEGKVNLISNENLSGRQQFGGEGGKFEKALQIAEKLNKKFPNAKIIVGKRKIESWLPSLYSQYVKNGGILEYNEWYKIIFDKKFTEFGKYITYLNKLFDEVFVYDLDLLKKNPKEFIREICKFMGVKEPIFENKIINPKLNEEQIKLMKFLNRLWVPREKTVVNRTDLRHYIGFLPRKAYFNPLFVTRILTNKYFLFGFLRFIGNYIRYPNNRKENWKEFGLNYTSK